MKQLLDNVSLFWSKYFEDSEVLHSLVEGAISYIANIKQESYSYLLSTSVDSTPLHLRKENILLELEDINFLSITSGGSNFLVYDLGNTEKYVSIPYLMGHPNSDTFLENNVDFIFFKGDSKEVIPSLTSELNNNNYYILFGNGDPRKPGNFPQVSFRKEDGYAQGNYKVLGVNFPSNIPTNTEIELLNVSSEPIQKCRVVQSSTDSIFLHPSTPVNDISNTKSIRILGEEQLYEVASVEPFIYKNNKLQVWAPIVKKDTQLLQTLYSHTHSAEFTESTERYRNFLLGLNSLKTRPMSIENIKSSICLCANVPVFNSSYEDDGDRIIRVDTSARCTTVYTTLAKYEIPPNLTIDPRITEDAIELSSEGVTTTNRGATHQQTFFFKELQPLITDIKVLRGIDPDSSWWDRGLGSPQFIEIPEGIMLNEPLDRRVVINSEYPNNIGSVLVTYDSKTYKLPPAAIGDYGIEIGQATRNTIAYTLFNDFLKHHTVFVELSEAFYSLPDFSSEILKDVRKTLSEACLPGSLVILGLSIDAILEDIDSDSIPDIIDPVITP